MGHHKVIETDQQPEPSLVPDPAPGQTSGATAQRCHQAGSDIKYYAVAADWVLARMDESGMDVKLLLLDACRDNPLGRSFTRALPRGLAVMETPQGALIAYATSPGKTASDGQGRNSPFTAQLLRELGSPGRDIEVTLKAVRAGVQQATQGQQIPWVASSMTGNFYVAR